MVEDKNSYINITKSIWLFGGTKIFQILVGIIKNKAVAFLLGPVGMGITGMITSTTSIVSALTGLGLHTSAVRDVAQSHASNDQQAISRTITILRKLVMLTGLFGMLVVFSFAKPLSILTFGDDTYTMAFQIVSITLLLEQLAIGQNVIFQGTFHYKYMVKAALIGSVLVLVISLPIYYVWRLDAIVPVILVTSLLNLAITIYYANQVNIPSVNLSLREVWRGGRVMILLGFSIAMASMIGMAKVYIERNFLVKIGSLEVVGLYIAGTTIVTQYVNIIFQAMGSDYSPRLSAISNDKSLFVETINRQAVLLITLLAPLVMVFNVFIKELILLLYSEDFLPIMGMIEWMMLGMLFRAVSWSISFGFTALGEAKAFFYNELLSNVYSIIFTILGYQFFSYEGMGIGFFLTYILYTIQVFVLGKIRFNFHFNNDVKRKSFPMILLIITLVLILKLITISWLKLAFGIVFTVIISIISYRWLDQMIDMKLVLNGIRVRLSKK